MDRKRQKGKSSPHRGSRSAFRQEDGSGFEWRRFAPHPVYVILALVMLGSVVASLLYPHVEVVDRFLPNLAAETFGILLTLIFVHRFLGQQDRARRMRASVGALRKGNRALSELIHAWSAMIKGSLRHIPGEPILEVETLFAPHMTENLLHADPRARAGNPDDGDRPALAVLADRLVSTQVAFRSIVESYGLSLDSSYVEILDELVDDPFMGLILDLAGEADLDARAWRTRLAFKGGLRETYFSRLLWLLDLHNSVALETARVRNVETAARSSLGTRLSLDHDLLVPMTLPAGWWHEAPGPGSLCAAEIRREPAL